MRVTRSFSLLCGAVSVMLLGVSLPARAQDTHTDSTYRWSAPAHSVDRLVIKNLQGDIRVTGSNTDIIEVRAVKRWKTGDPRTVTFDVSQVGAGGRTTLLCASWRGATLACSVEGHVVNNNGSNDTRVDFEVRVPRGMNVRMATVNGAVHLARLDGPISASTVNGNVTVAFGEAPDADLSFSSVNGSLRSDFELPISTDCVAARRAHGWETVDRRCICRP